MDIPRKYEDLTVEQFQKLEALKTTELDSIDKACHRLAILSNKSVEYIESLTPKEVYDTLAHALFLSSEINVMPIKESIKLGNKEFKFIDKISGYSISQHRDIHEFIKLNNNNYFNCLPEIIALCHYENVGNEFKYIENNHHENVELFKKAKLEDVLGAVFFYSNCYKSYKMIIQTSLAESEKAIKEMMRDLEFQTFLKDGGLNIGLAK